MQQERVTRRTVRRIDKCAAEQAERDHAELLSRARRASKRAQEAARRAAALVEEIEACVR